jgi:hypothetical protein
MHVDPLLTNMAVGWQQDLSGFLAGRVFPTVPVNEASGIYGIWPTGSIWRDEMRRRPLGGELERVDYSVSTDSFAIEEWGVKHYVDDRVRRNASNPFDPDIGAGRLLSGMAAINAERRWATNFFGTGIWSNDITGVAATPTAGTEILQWDQSAADPADLLEEYQILMEEATGGKSGNVMIIGRNVWKALKANTAFKDQVKYTQRGVITRMLAAELLELDDLFVAKSVYNDAQEGLATNISRIVGADDGLLLHRNMNVSATGDGEPTAGVMLAWQNLVPGATNPLGAVIERGRDDQKYSDIFAVRNAIEFKVVAADLGIFFSGLVA